jgi:hypothetical protein
MKVRRRCPQPCLLLQMFEFAESPFVAAALCGMLAANGDFLRCQELYPDLVATCSGTPSVVEGHPFVVEAGVSLGGKRAKEGITVFRFANRIPLLFEGGGDVVTRTALKRIKYVPLCLMHVYP